MAPGVSRFDLCAVLKLGIRGAESESARKAAQPGKTKLDFLDRMMCVNTKETFSW